MKREGFTLFWSIPPDAQDWDNLRTSGVKRVQLVASFADHDTVAKLGAMGIKCAVRLDEPDYGDDGVRAQQRDKLAALQPLGVVDTVIIGVEPENTLNCKYGSLTWGENEAWDHAAKLTAMVGLVKSLGLRTVSAGWTARGIDMNWSNAEGVQPGLYTWFEITRTAYDI